MTGGNNLLVLGICFLLSGAVHASHNGVNTDFGPGNSGAAKNDALVDPTQPNCVGDWLSASASTTKGLDIPAFMEFFGGPGTITQGISDLMGLGGVIGYDQNPLWNYPTCEDHFFAQP